MDIALLETRKWENGGKPLQSILYFGDICSLLAITGRKSPMVHPVPFSPVDRGLTLTV
jgi:hypothetical protein